jgi:hypothetical protein
MLTKALVIERLTLNDIEGGPCDLAGVECIQQGRFIDQPPARRIHEIGPAW